MVLTLTDTFMQSLASLDPADGKRAAAFVGKLVKAPEAAALRPEIVHDAHDRSIRSFKVTHDLRAIAHMEGERLMLIHVARHDRAYKWARTHCVVCMAEDGTLGLIDISDHEGGEIALNPRDCCSADQFAQLFERYSARG